MMGFVILVIALVILALGAAYYAYRVAFFVSPRYKQDIYDLPQNEKFQAKREIMCMCIQGLHELPYEEVTITAADGKKLFGRYYHNVDGAPLQIQFHGYRGSAMRDFCGGTAFAKKLGHNALVVDQRSHGHSEGNTITFGIRERYDCQSWANYAYHRFGKDTPLILSGVSMGATTVLMASDLELPETVCGIVADCPYSSPKDIITKVAGEFGLPRKPAAAICGLGALIYGHFRVGDGSALESVRHTKLPILLLHGEADQLVPCHMSHQIYDACTSDKELQTFPGASHGMCYLEDPQRYESTVGGFLNRCLSRKMA
jgi:fermentation-respiration switch protein FrsA (DUF1100 family)